MEAQKYLEGGSVRAGPALAARDGGGTRSAPARERQPPHWRIEGTTGALPRLRLARLALQGVAVDLRGALAEANEDDLLRQGMRVEEASGLGDGNGGGALQGKAKDARADGREGNGADVMLLGQR